MKNHTLTICYLSLLMLFPKILFSSNDLPDRHPEGQLVFKQNANSSTNLQLQVTEAQLSDVLDKISSKTGIPLHYSDLPGKTITATCVGANIKQLLTCLLGPNTNLVYQYVEEAHHKQNNNKQQPSEIWLLSSSINTCQEDAAVSAEIQQTLPQSSKSTANDATTEEQLLQSIARAKAKDAKLRSQALTELSNIGSTDDSRVNEILLEALSDDDATVRQQALSGLFRREGNAISDLVQQTLLEDKDANVRLKALNYVGDDTALLEQALNDNDPNVRRLAKLKLSVLTPEK